MDEDFAEFAFRLFMLRYDLSDALVELRKHESGMHKPFCAALHQLINQLNEIQRLALEIEERPK